MCVKGSFLLFFAHFDEQKIIYFFSSLKLYNYFEDSNYVYLVVEMCHNGEMSRYLKEQKMPFSEDEGQSDFTQYSIILL